jgi:histidinol-phosphatase (PHP family)
VPEDFVQAAISEGFRAYGFSSHSPLPFDTFWNMQASDMPEYLNEISRLKEKYKERLEIYTSLEIDYLDEIYNPSSLYFRELPLDYRIGSVHFIPVKSGVNKKSELLVCIDGHFGNFEEAIKTYFNGDIKRFVQRYYESVMDMVKAGGIDIVGHIDKIYMNAQYFDGFSVEAGWYKEIFAATLELIKQKEIIVEINTKNFNRKAQTYPHLQYLALLKDLKIPVMVNSDCHLTHLINDGRLEILELLKTTGFKTTRELIKGEWEDIPF